MYRTKVDARTLETQLKAESGNEYCTFADIERATGMSYKAARNRLRVLAPLPGTRPHRYLARQAAQVIAGDRT